MYEAEVAKLQGARITLENQALSLESATVNIEVFKTVEQGTAAMKGLRGNIDAERVDELMDDMAEEKDTADQISDAISRPAQDLFDDVSTIVNSYNYNCLLISSVCRSCFHYFPDVLNV